MTRQKPSSAGAMDASEKCPGNTSLSLTTTLNGVPHVRTSVRESRKTRAKPHQRSIFSLFLKPTARLFNPLQGKDTRYKFRCDVVFT
jgi:hypothetical protein